MTDYHVVFLRSITKVLQQYLQKILQKYLQKISTAKSRPSFFVLYISFYDWFVCGFCNEPNNTYGFRIILFAYFYFYFWLKFIFVYMEVFFLLGGFYFWNFPQELFIILNIINNSSYLPHIFPLSRDFFVFLTNKKKSTNEITKKIQKKLKNMKPPPPSVVKQPSIYTLILQRIHS